MKILSDRNIKFEQITYMKSGISISEIEFILKMLNAKPKDIKWIILASVIGFVSTKYGVAFMGPKIGYIFPGFCIAAFSNFVATQLQQPASITILPGMYYMVPGSIGFKTIQFLLFDRFSDFLHSGVSLLFISISLVAGISFGNILVPPRRSL